MHSVEQNTAAGVSFLSLGLANKATARQCFVFLHGIGSGAASWSEQFAAIAQRNEHCIALAWDAPGYGDSNALLLERPKPRHYASAMWAWLDALSIHSPITLVGHSLGCLVAAAAAWERPANVARVILLAPALGYGQDSVEKQNSIAQKRLDTLTALGSQGMAQQRAAAMLSENASAVALEKVRSIMARIRPDGYTQAVRMLVQGDLLTDLAALKRLPVALPVQVACGSLDTITPAVKCENAAGLLGQELIDLGPVGHACAIEGSAAVNALLGIEAQ